MPGFGVALFRRLGGAAATLFVVLTVTFFALRALPGEATAAMTSDRIPVEHRERLERIYGLDRPLLLQYGSWLREIAGGNWGVSFVYQRPVLGVIREHLPATLALGVAAGGIYLLLGVGLGVGAARRRGSRIDRLLRFAAITAYATPTFWLAVMALLLFASVLGWFPAGGLESMDAARLGGAERFVDRLRHLVLPALVLALPLAAELGRLLRASLVEALDTDFTRGARARAVSERRILWLHALRRALSPALQSVALTLPLLISGAFAVEFVFSLPGMGVATLRALLARDYPLVMAVTALSGGAVVVATLAADVATYWIDPRLRRLDAPATLGLDGRSSGT